MNDNSQAEAANPGTSTRSTSDRAAQLDSMFGKMVEALIKPGADIIRSLSPSRINALHMGVGVSGEAGELLDAVKKYVIYDKPLDRANVVEELGDLEFYMQGLRAELGITREETLQANIAKLSKRYHSGGYTDAQAQQRADKPEGQ